MKIRVQVKAGSGEYKVEELGPGEYKVWVKDPPERGLANRAVIMVLAKHLGVSRSALAISTGHTSRTKIVTLTS